MTMSAPAFYKQLALLAAITLAALLALTRYPLFQSHQTLYGVFLAFYTVAAIVLFIIGKKLAPAKNKNAFTLFVMGASFGKMILTMGVLVAYLKLSEPESKFFILPFLLVYVIFAVFDAWFLMKIGRTT